MKHVKKFTINENAGDDNYDYEGGGWTKPITMESVREAVVEILANYEMEDTIDSPEVQAAIDKFVKRRMFGFWNDINYMEENFEGDFESIASGDYK